MNQKTDPTTHFKDYNTRPASEQSRLAELVDVASLLSSTTTQQKQLNMRVPISHFNYFMPFFLGIKPIEDPNALRNMWLACCQSLQHDVDVFNDQNHAEILFTVPAYIDSDILKVNPATLAGDSFDRLRRRMESEQNFPEQAVNGYLNEINRRTESLIRQNSPQDKYNEKARMWAKIYSFYGIQLNQTIGYAEGKTSHGVQQGFNSSNPFGSFGGFNSSL